MTRMVLAFLLLCGCQSEPGGMIQPDERGRIEILDVRIGDSAPFKLKGGDVDMLYVIQGNIDVAKAALCQSRMSLIRYGEDTGREIPLGSPLTDNTRLNAVRPGVYYVHLAAGFGYCRYELLLSPR